MKSVQHLLNSTPGRANWFQYPWVPGTPGTERLVRLPTRKGRIRSCCDPTNEDSRSPWLREEKAGSTMEVTKLTLPSNAAMPLIAALPYRVVFDGPEVENSITYNPETQLSVFASRRDYSTCREDESAGHLFQSKSDTKKDD